MEPFGSHRQHERGERQALSDNRFGRPQHATQNGTHHTAGTQRQLQDGPQPDRHSVLHGRGTKLSSWYSKVESWPAGGAWLDVTVEYTAVAEGALRVPQTGTK